MKQKQTFVNFGAGNPADGWENLDNSPFFMLPSVIHNILFKFGFSTRSRHYLSNNYTYYSFTSNKRLPYKNNSVNAIYTSHVLEHLSLEEIENFFLESKRVLKKNGVVRVVVPDLERKIKLNKSIFSLEYELLTLPTELKGNKFRAALEAFHGFPSFHKTMFIRKNIQNSFKSEWSVSIKKGFLDSSIDKNILKKVEQQVRTKDALIFELTKNNH